MYNRAFGRGLSFRTASKSFLMVVNEKICKKLNQIVGSITNKNTNYTDL
jgi:hypothetical protein